MLIFDDFLFDDYDYLKLFWSSLKLPFILTSKQIYLKPFIRFMPLKSFYSISLLKAFLPLNNWRELKSLRKQNTIYSLFFYVTGTECVLWKIIKPFSINFCFGRIAKPIHEGCLVTRCCWTLVKIRWVIIIAYMHYWATQTHGKILQCAWWI